MQNLLDTTGSFQSWSRPESTVTFSSETNAAELSTRDLSAATIIIEFSAMADGRGFSLAHHLLKRRRFDGTLLASGPVIPDQVSMLFQCGFSGILIGDAQRHSYGEEAWLQALDNAVGYSYTESHRPDLLSIWQQRMY